MTEREVQEALGAPGEINVRVPTNYWRDWNSTEGHINIRFSALYFGRYTGPPTLEGEMVLCDGRKLKLRPDPAERWESLWEWVQWKTGL